LSEGESVVSEPVLSIERNIQLSLLLVVVIKLPSWSLAMDSVDKVWISVLSEWIGNELGLLGEGLSTSGESAFWITESHESAKVVVLEINSQEQLRLQVSW
jgi:hypothetical protein